MDLTGAIANATLALLLLWLILALLFGGLPAAWLAVTRGREPFLWLAAGTLIGPLAVLLVGFAPLGTKGEWGRCLQCSSPVRRGAARCPYCGSDGSGRLP